MSELKCPACKTNLFLQTKPGKRVKALCPFCGARFREGKAASRKLPSPPTVDEVLRGQNMWGREWVTWTGRAEPHTWLVSWDRSRDWYTLHAQIMEGLSTTGQRCWDYWAWVKVGNKRQPRRGFSSKSLADAKKGCSELFWEAGDIDWVELPSAR